jgi:hypothetical protein
VLILASLRCDESPATLGKSNTGSWNVENKLRPAWETYISIEKNGRGFLCKSNVFLDERNRFFGWYKHVLKFVPVNIGET